MVSKDQAIGGVILIVCLLIAVLYAVTLFYPQWLSVVGVNDTEKVQFWVVAIPVLLAFIAVMAIGAWIGWTMATTPPPKPIEEITAELEKKEEETKTIENEEKAQEKKKKGDKQ
jgi:predicted DNA-binding transcriptional regulator